MEGLRGLLAYWACRDGRIGLLAYWACRDGRMGTIVEHARRSEEVGGYKPGDPLQRRYIEDDCDDGGSGGDVSREVAVVQGLAGLGSGVWFDSHHVA